jgi:hypothetical protein
MRKKYKRTHNKKLKTYRKEKKSHSHRRKIKSRRRKFKKYNKSLKKTFKGGTMLGVGEGVAAVLGATAAVGAIVAGIKHHRGKKKDDVVDLDDLSTIDDVIEVDEHKKRKTVIDDPAQKPKVTYIEPEGAPYNDLLIDDSTDNIWLKYCPHYTTEQGYNTKEYAVGEDWTGESVHTVTSMKWKTGQADAWAYNVQEDDGLLTTFTRNLDEVDGGFNPDYGRLKDLLKILEDAQTITNVPNRQLLTKGTIVIPNNSHADRYGYKEGSTHLECLGIIWSPIENTWRVIYDNIEDDNIPRHWVSATVYNIKLDDISDMKSNYGEMFGWEYFGINESLAKQKLSQAVGDSVNVRDYLFNSKNNSFIKIRSIRWVTEAQKWDIVYYDYQKNETIYEPWSSDFLDDYTKLDPPKYRLGNNGKKYGTVKYLNYLKKQKLFNLEIKKIIYNGRDGQYNYTIQEEYNLNPASSVRNMQIVVGSEQTLTEPDLDKFIKNNYTIGTIGA